MRAHALELRRKVVEAVRQGMPKAEAARTFGVGISTVKRYVDRANKGENLSSRKPPGKKRKLDRGGLRVLEYHLDNYPFATLRERRNYLAHDTGIRVSEATVSRAIKRLGWVRIKDRWVPQRGIS